MRIPFAVFLTPLLLGCTSLDSAPAAPGPPTIETAVTVDSRIELIGVIQLLAGYFLVSGLDSDYKREAKAFFAPCADDPAVKKFAELSAAHFNFNTVPDAFIALSEPPMLEQRYAAKSGIVEAAGGAESYAEFLELTRAFARECRFEEFYSAQRPYYDRLIAQSRQPVLDSTRTLSDYLGTPLGSSEVVLGPLLHDGGFATRYDGRDGNPIAFAFIGPEGLSDGETDFGTAERLQPLIAHEFAHTVINPLTTRFAADVSASEGNLQAVAEAMQREGYSRWEQVVNESIIRALTARLTTLERGEVAGQAEIADEVRRGFVYVPALIESLKRYEAHKSRYPTIEAYYPDLLKVFRNEPSQGDL